MITEKPEQEQRDYSIISETPHLFIVNKESPIAVLPGKRGNPSLRELARERGKFAFLEAPHRLDARTSGIVVFCKTRESLSCMGRLFQHGLVHKTYLAVVENRGKLEGEQGSLRHRLFHDERSNKTFAKAAGPETSRDTVELRWILRGKSDSYLLLEVLPLQGKTHQIRAQLAAAGMPIAGDSKYGSRYRSSNGLILLHAAVIEFPCPQSSGIAIKEGETLLGNLDKAEREASAAEREALELFSGKVLCRAETPLSEALWSSF